jgi:hypothetical protein
MHSQNRWTGMVVGVVMGVLLSAAGLLAGDLAPSAGPTEAGSQMYTLEQIYNRINNGATANKETAFKEPSSGPTAGTGHTLNEIMGKLPALDDTSGAVPGNVVAGKTYWGLTSGQWGLQTGTGSGGTNNAGVPRTGQTPTVPLNPAPTGSDGALQKGVTWPNPRFTDNPNGTVTDNLTGLIWLKNANCFGTRTWAVALVDANSLANGNCSLSDGSAAGDWRLPNVKELQSLIDFAYYNPALSNTVGTGQWEPGNPFTGVLSDYYWSSTTVAGSPTGAWYVVLNYGVVNGAEKDSMYYVWPVRGGQ